VLALVPALVAVDEESPVREPLPSPEEIAQLPPDGGEEFNRLIFEPSPYLRQHARNPVDWYPWGEAAFARASAEDKPVFLSIGYSTCHWCHVMEHESFEDEEVAALMNEAFVCIKVDREERPDLDQVYMQVTQAMTGRGGWPMTVVMTPRKKPFFAATYIPKSARGGREGMLTLVPELARLWRERRDEIEEQAEEVVDWLQRSQRTRGAVELDAGVLDEAFEALARRFDEEQGGFGTQPKFPMPHHLRFLLRHARRTGDERALEMVRTTLNAMRSGGIWDHVGFGFHRYSTDREWLVPHFEKMLYDQALIAMAYVEAWQVFGDDRFRATAERILAYVLRDMTASTGAFWSAEDADSEGEEGRFYLWTPPQLRAALGADDAELAAEVWNVVPGGNYVDEAARRKTGRSILHLTVPLARQARDREDPAAFLERVERIRARLFEVREARVHPFKDDKVLTDWNGLMIAACALAGRVLDADEYTQAARRAADFVLDELRSADGRLWKRYRVGHADHAGLLEDYAFSTWGLIELFETTQEPRWLEVALELTATLNAHFWDAEDGGYFTAPDDGEELIVRARDAYDGAIPSGNSVAALNLLRLARLTGRVELEERAWKLMSSFSGELGRRPSGSTQMLCALDFALGPAYEIVVAGDPRAPDTRATLSALHEVFAPNKVVLLRPPGARVPIVELAPFAAAQRPVDGRATIYLCENFTCRAPTHDVDAVLTTLTER